MTTVHGRSRALEPRHLRYVLVLAEHGSLRQSAAELALPATVLAREIKQIESAVGTCLFERRRSRVCLTVAGRELAEFARRALEARRLALRETGPDHARLRVGFMDYPPGQAIQRAALAEFRAQYPHVSVELVPVPFRLQAGAVTAGTLDVGFHFGPLERLDGICTALLMPEVVSCVLLPSGHRLATRRELSMSDLVGTPLHTMRTDDSPEVMAAVHDAIARGGWHGRQTSGSSSPSEVMGMVASGAGWSPAPSALIAWAPPSLAVRPLADAPLAGFDMHILWRDGHPDATAFTQLMLDLRPILEGPPQGGQPLQAGRRWIEEKSRVVEHLHHAMLQDIVGSQLSLRALGKRLAPDQLEARAIVEDTSAGLTRVGRVARQAIRTIQGSEPVSCDIALDLVTAAAELGSCSNAAFSLRTTGARRTLDRDIRALARRVGVAALRSAFGRSDARNVSVSLDFGEDTFCLVVADDGLKVPDDARDGAAQCEGPAALRRNEAARGAVLTVRHDPAMGTRVELRVPLQAAFVVATD